MLGCTHTHIEDQSIQGWPEEMNNNYHSYYNNYHSYYNNYHSYYNNYHSYYNNYKEKSLSIECPLSVGIDDLSCYTTYFSLIHNPT